MPKNTAEESRMPGQPEGDIILQVELRALANKQTALFHATADLSKKLGQLGARLNSGAVVEPGIYTFDPGLVLVRTSAHSREPRDLHDSQDRGVAARANAQ